MKHLFGLLVLALPVAANSGYFFELSKNEMTGESTQVYHSKSTNHDSYTMNVWCKPGHGLSVDFTYERYRGISTPSYQRSFDYKLDNRPIKKYKESYRKADYKKLLAEIIPHKTLVIAPYPNDPSLPTPKFNISDLKHKIKRFKPSCQVDPKKVSKPTPKANTLTHTHGERSHQHPLPAVGIAHSHGGGAVGTK